MVEAYTFVSPAAAPAATSSGPSLASSPMVLVVLEREFARAGMDIPGQLIDLRGALFPLAKILGRRAPPAVARLPSVRMELTRRLGEALGDRELAGQGVVWAQAPELAPLAGDACGWVARVRGPFECLGADEVREELGRKAADRVFGPLARLWQSPWAGPFDAEGWERGEGWDLSGAWDQDESAGIANLLG